MGAEQSGMSSAENMRRDRVKSDQVPSKVNLYEIHPALWLGNVTEAERMLNGGSEYDYDKTVAPVNGVCIASDKTCQECLRHPEKCIAITGFKDSKYMSEDEFREGMHQAADAIHNQLQNGHTMINCHAGVNRSAAAVCMYACKYRGWSANDAINYIRKMNNTHRHLPALTNETFVEYLIHIKELRGGAKAQILAMERESGMRNLKYRRMLNNAIRKSRV